MTTTASAPDRQHNALQIIFAFFLGIMVLAFIGVGVNTFYPSPVDKQIQALSEQQNALSRKAGGGAMTPAQQAEYDSLQKQIDGLQVKSEAEMKTWARNTSIVLVLLATAVMALSLIQSERLKVLSNGLLLGGLFTMVYGVGWVIFSGSSTARFVVIAFALAVTVALGYVKFVRQRAVAPESASQSAATPASGDVAALSERVAALEARAAAAAAALSPNGERDR